MLLEKNEDFRANYLRKKDETLNFAKANVTIDNGVMNCFVHLCLNGYIMQVTAESRSYQLFLLLVLVNIIR
jgi:hypothetical protein